MEPGRTSDRKSNSSPPLASTAPETDKSTTTTTTTSMTAGNAAIEEQKAQDAKLRPEREAGMGDYIRIFKYANFWDSILMVVAAIASLASGVTLPLMNVVFGALVGDFTNYFNNPPTTTEAQFRRALDRNALYIFLLFVGKFILTYISKFAYRMIGIRMSAAVRLDYLRCLFGQTIHTTTANVLQLGISEKLGTLFEYTATVIAGTVVAFVYSWSLALVTSSAILFIVIATSIILPFTMKGTAKVTNAETKSSSVASEAFSSIRMIVACGAESEVAQRFSVWAMAAKRHGQRTAPLIAAQFGIIFFALYAAFSLAFWYGTKSFSEGRISDLSTIVVTLTSILLMVISLERIANPLLAIGKAAVAACEFFTVIDAPRPETGELKEPDVSATQDIVFKDVDFAYPSRSHVKVLDQLNLRIEAGKLTAIVGPSGSGKSTIVGLIERWYTLHDQHIIAKAIDKEKKKKKGKDGDQGNEDDLATEDAPETRGPPVELKGSVSTCDRDLNAIDLKWWRSQIGLVQQEPFLFHDTVYNNVAHGLIGSEWENESDERKKELVREACKEAFADEFIDRLPEGYDTLVGDNGMKLSGGQRQRLCIARAVIKRPKILILDEATSAIDVRGERIVQAALDKVSRNRTTITIAHRLSTIKKADTIVVLKKGRVVEQGTHESLLRDENGVYYGLVHAQHLSLGETTDDGGDDDALEEEEEGEAELSGALSHKKSATGDVAVHKAEGGAIWKARGMIGSFGRLLYEQRSKFPLYGIILVASITSAAGSPVQAYLFAKIVAVFNLTYDPALFTREANFWSLMWLVVAIGIGLSYFTVTYVASHVAHHVSSHYRQQYFEDILHQKTVFFDEKDNSTGTLTARVGGDPKQLEELLGANMAMVVISVFTLIGSMAIAFAFGWKLAIVALTVTAPLGLLAGYYRLKYELEFEKLYGEVFAESSKFAAEAIGAFRTVSSLTLEDRICDRYDRLLSGHVGKAYKKSRWSTLIFAFSDSVSLACQGLIFWYGGTLLASREYGIVNFFVCYLAVIQGAEAAGQGFSFGPNAAQATAAANRILSMRTTRHRENGNDELDDSSNNNPKPPSCIPDTEGGIRIELQDVHFAYPTRSAVPVLRGLNLTVEKGQFAALVGASGCGKTSVVSLLERFYDPQRGRILANGVDIATVPAAAYRRHLALVAQEPTLFQGTLRENILLGRGASPAKTATATATEKDNNSNIKEEEDRALHAACRDANIHDFIASLPEGYDTAVGSKGVSLSGGQKQRVAIARALARQPALLLLDEATSSLDSESEALVQATFESAAARGRTTTLVVAHRLATVQNADVIYVLGEGGVLEKGSHAELLRKKGVYWNMCQSQALDR
ncbi:P-loop containing nucleoside triphosphate hydrolase protein [Biscogniauxia mediterranea]|nr:P-loop containing nucleoside triphosphate hydrolase protein [Biscogniauxia mediterranea]